MSTHMSDERFVQDYEWFKSFYMPDTRIAQLMGISPSVLEKRRERSGLHEPCPPQIAARLQALIDAGRPFGLNDFAAHLAPQQIANALSAAHRAGHITRLGTRNHPLHRSRIAVYQAPSAPQHSCCSASTASGITTATAAGLPELPVTQPHQ